MSKNAIKLLPQHSYAQLPADLIQVISEQPSEKEVMCYSLTRGEG